MKLDRRRFLSRSVGLGAVAALGVVRSACTPNNRMSPPEGHLRKDKIEQAARLLREAVESGELGSATMLVARDDYFLVEGFGNPGLPETVYLLASITKPMTAAGVMRLVDRGRLTLDDPVSRHLPEFQGEEREKVTVRMLLNHTSGLPDMLPENVELRRRHAPLSDFVAAACRTPLLFEPGARVSYQSKGILLAAEIAERLSGRPFRDFLRDEIFLPLTMRDTSLGLGGRAIAETAFCQVAVGPAEYGGGEEQRDWDWNSPYWRDLGAPWGGAHGSAPDVDRFLLAFLEPERNVLAPETVREMIRNQTEGLDDARGLGWMVRPGTFGEACSDRTFGHWGATGTVAWADPATRLRCVLLTTLPAVQSRETLLKPVCDLVAESA